MNSRKTNATAARSPGSLFPSGATVAESLSACGTPTNPQDQDGRLTWLDLHTRTDSVRAALKTLFTEAMGETSDAKRAGLFLLSLWSPGQYPLDLNELGFFERELNFAVRHLLNFIIAGQVNFRQIVTYSEIAPVIAAWGKE